MRDLWLKTSDALGDSLMLRPLIPVLWNVLAESGYSLRLVATKNQEELWRDFETGIPRRSGTVVDASEYLDLMPFQRTTDSGEYKHLMAWQAGYIVDKLREACPDASDSLGRLLDDDTVDGEQFFVRGVFPGGEYAPRLRIKPREMGQAWDVADKIRNAACGRPVFTVGVSSSSKNKDYSRWSEVESLLEQGSERPYFVTLVPESSAMMRLGKHKGEVPISLRIGMGLMSMLDGGISVDSFQLHALAAARVEGESERRVENVIGLFGSSRPEVVSYPGVVNLAGETNCPVRFCGNHGYVSGNFGRALMEFGYDNHRFRDRCVSPDSVEYACMKAISPERVAQEIMKMIR